MSGNIVAVQARSLGSAPPVRHVQLSPPDPTCTSRRPFRGGPSAYEVALARCPTTLASCHHLHASCQSRPLLKPRVSSSRLATPNTPHKLDDEFPRQTLCCSHGLYGHRYHHCQMSQHHGDPRRTPSNLANRSSRGRPVSQTSALSNRRLAQTNLRDGKRQGQGH
jgi:hypothetical protein